MKARYENAQTFRDYLDGVEARRELWHQIHQRARVPVEILDRARALDGEWRLLVLAEDWCGDAVNSLPYLARLVEAAPALEMRVLSRDGNPDLMDTHLSGEKRAIPVVMILDGEYREVAWWSSRPAPLEELFLAELKDLPKGERFARLRAWYARDRGRAILSEILDRIPVQG